MIIVLARVKWIIEQFIVFSVVLLFVLSITKYAVAQDINEKLPLNTEVASVVKEIAKYNVVESESVGDGGGLSVQWRRFEKLNSIASDVELRALTNDTNAVVRCYSFHALALRKDSALFSILLRHLNDIKEVSTLSYDVGGADKVGDYFIDVLTPKYVDLRAYKLNTQQREKLDSILIYDKKIHLWAKEQLLSKLKPQPNNYERVREMALTERNSFAVVALAKYKNHNDVQIIKDYLKNSKMQYYAVCAVKEFPDPEFYPELIQLFEKDWNENEYGGAWHMLYQALAQYPTPQTEALFERTFIIKDDFRRQMLGEHLLVAITKYPNPLFQNVKNKIKLDEYYRDEFVEDISRESEK
jgi:hypothetical protein